MNKTNTGGSAFPIGIDAFAEDKEGMTLRDYFAAKAMQTILPFFANSSEDMQGVADKAYAMADLMLKAREA